MTDPFMLIPMTLAAWFHDWSPFIVRFSEGVGIRWYGVSYALAFALAWWRLTRLGKRGLTTIPPFRSTDAILALVVGTVVGGRLGYVLFYQRELLWTFTDSAPWWSVLAINKGGMASHGGMVGITLACWWISRGWKDEKGVRKHQSPLLHVMDVMAYLAPLGVLLGRLANFINGELLGVIVAKPGAPAPWWAVKFPQERLEDKLTPELTEQQTAALTAIIERFAQPNETLRAGYLRVLDRVQHGDGLLARELAPLISARAPSQLIQAFAEGIVLWVFMLLLWRTPRKPGVIVSWFLIGYGVLRIITEIWRLPDAHLASPLILGLSRGQWLSVAMIVIGAALLRFALRAKSTPMGGWGKR